MHPMLTAQGEERAAEFEAALEPGHLPTHVAVIMDGNGRWGQARGLTRTDGHRESIEAIRRTVTAADDLHLGYLSLYCFSTENLQRPVDEVDSLFHLFAEVLNSETDELHRKNVRIIVTGMLDYLPEELAAQFHTAIALTKDNTGLTLNLCVMYSGRAEIIAGRFDPARLNERTFRQFLFQPSVPDPDLVIRTSGELRISNFLLWQMAYSEMVFTEVLWPDFTRADFLAALLDYQQRARRFGKV
jgi:undecaprenyl diphosphate synthase